MNPPLLLEEAPVVRRRADGLLEYRCPPLATPGTLNAFFDRIQTLAQGRAIGLLIDLRPHEAMDAAARSVIYRRGAELRRVRMAVVTTSRFQRAMATFLAMATRTNVRCFESFEEATGWLMQ